MSHSGVLPQSASPFSCSNFSESELPVEGPRKMYFPPEKFRKQLIAVLLNSAMHPNPWGLLEQRPGPHPQRFWDGAREFLFLVSSLLMWLLFPGPHLESRCSTQYTSAGASSFWIVRPCFWCWEWWQNREVLVSYSTQLISSLCSHAEENFLWRTMAWEDPGISL